MRPTDFCHLNDLRAPVPRAFPAHSATFITGTPHGVLGSVRLTRGPSVSRHSDHFGGSQLTRTALPLPSRTVRCVDERAWAFSSHECLLTIEPLTPLSPLPLPRNVGAPSRCLASLGSCELLRSRFPREEAAKAALTTAL
jgi:hypothetical protein